MSKKTLKNLRRIAAQTATEALGYYSEGNSRKQIFVYPDQTAEEKAQIAKGQFAGELVGKEPKVMTHPGTLRVNPKCARGVYKMLKKAVRRTK
jgi:hypothetical protein